MLASLEEESAIVRFSSSTCTSEGRPASKRQTRREPGETQRFFSVTSDFFSLGPQRRPDPPN